MRNTCGDCQHYGNGPVTGPICTKTKKQTSVLMVKDCFEARTSALVTVTKVCAKCHLELPVENFGHTKKNKNGLKSYCRDCENENCRKYRAKRYGQPKKERKPKTVDFPVINDLLPQPVPAISTFTDDALIAELRLRGWHGTITKDTVIL